MSAANALRLAGCHHRHGYDLAEAFQEWANTGLREIAERIGSNRTSVHLCLSGKRSENAVRRSIEIEFHLPPYCLDTMIQRSIDGTRTRRAGLIRVKALA